MQMQVDSTLKPLQVKLWVENDYILSVYPGVHKINTTQDMPSSTDKA